MNNAACQKASVLGSVSEPAPAARPSVGVVLEGGGFRGLFTAGVLDVWMERGLPVDAAVGVSAGACFGCNIKSHQIGRALRYNLAYATDKRYASFGNWLRTGDLYSLDFAYREVPLVLDPVDEAAFMASPLRFTVVCTDIETGRPVYHDIEHGDVEDIDWIRASASIPVLSQPVELGGYRMLDGGVADAIPVSWMRAQGYDRTVVVLTQPAGYRKEKNNLLPLLRVALRRYPALIADLEDRHVRYNRTLDAIEAAERAGDLFVIRPHESVKMPAVIKDTAQLQRAYDIGREDAEATFTALETYLRA